MESRLQKILSMIESSPQDCFLHHAAGLEYQKIFDHQRAVDYFQKVIQIDKNYTGTYYHLAKSYQALDNISKAIETIETGKKIATLNQDKHAWNELEMALQELTDD